MIRKQTPRKKTRETETPAETQLRPKSILLFSDGTGNSSGKLFKTNVWRLYEAVDLGLAAASERVQIAYYDNGVGTSKIKALAMLGGIFGFGLQRNILAIYRFVCRNYEPGDKIYCFGFSRGAFTIRLVAALLATRGIVRYRSEAELNARTRDVLRDVQRENKPNLVTWLSEPARRDRDAAVAVKRLIFGPRLRPRTDFGGVDVEFVGVWDTVAAYGGPSAEITRAIDNFVYPLSMTDQYLSERVQVARHALALDDERDAFHPVLWDEWEWRHKARQVHGTDAAGAARFEQRMQQVWFAGMHSDVGGGYPDESLSFVSLGWMMQEAADNGVRFLPEMWARIRAMSNSLGPIHNSRSGLASYYRFQPRRIEAFIHKRALGQKGFEKTRSYRDPVRGEQDYPPQGFLLSCKVHESVVARIAHGTDDYAPITIPPAFDIVPFNFAGGGNPRIDKNAEAALQDSPFGWADQRERIYDRVWWRRVAYFFTVLVSAALVLMPLYAQSRMFPNTVDEQWVFGRLTSWMKFLPGVLSPWVDAFETSPILFVLLVATICGGTATGRWLETLIQSEMHRLWQKKLDGEQPGKPPGSWVRTLRLAPAYQRMVQWTKWYGLPWVVGIAMLLGIIYVALASTTQVQLSVADPALCPRTLADPAELATTGVSSFDASRLCNATKVQVRGQRPYSVELAVPVEGSGKAARPVWFDGSKPASPNGLSAVRLSWVGVLGAPFRRLVEERYMQVAFQIRPKDRFDGKREQVFVDGLTFRSIDKSRPRCWIYRADFVASGPGELFLFANDAVASWNYAYFYDHPRFGNRGVARVYVHDLHTLGGQRLASASTLPDPCQPAATAPAAGMVPRSR